MMKTIFSLAFGVCIGLAACTSVKPVVKDPGLYTTGNELAIKVKDGWLTAKTISLGAWSTSSRTNGTAPNTPARQMKNVSDAFYFTAKGPESELPVQVLSTGKITFSNRPLPAWLQSISTDAQLWYIHTGANAQDPLKTWELLLKRNIAFLELNENKPVGILRSSTEEIRVTAHNRYGIKNSTEKICYEFQWKGVPLAALLTGDTPRAWINTKADAGLQQTVAAVMLGLLFRN